MPVELDDADVAHIMAAALVGNGYEVTVDLEGQEVRDRSGWNARFSIDPFRRHSLLNGLDDIGLTLTLEAEIQAFEEARG